MRQYSRRKRVLKAGKRVNTQPLFPLSESHKRINLHNYNMYTEDLGQTYVGFASWISLGPYEPRFIDSVGFLVMVEDYFPAPIIP